MVHLRCLSNSTILKRSQVWQAQGGFAQMLIMSTWRTHTATFMGSVHIGSAYFTATMPPEC